jgi:uncharacterized protein
MIRLAYLQDLPVKIDYDDLVAICRKYQVAELAAFGSVLRPDFGPSSDVDFLVAFQNNDCGPWMSKLTDMQEDLARLLGRAVDLVNKRGIEQSANQIRREAILGSARVIYED